MTLKEELKKERAILAQRWIEKALACYPQDATKFFAREKDNFSNPVGNIIADGIRTLFDSLLTGGDREQFTTPLMDILRVRAVQDLPPSQAVSFVFSLKDIVRATLNQKLKNLSGSKELAEFDAEVDEIALMAFDVYMSCREKIFQVKAADIKRQVSGLLRRTGWLADEQDSEPISLDSFSDQHPKRGGVR